MPAADLRPAVDLLAQGRAEEAEAASLDLIAAGHGGDGRLHHLLALAREARGDPAGALLACRTALAESESFERRDLEGRLLRTLGRAGEARAAFEAAIRLNPGDMAARLHLALLLAGAGEHAAAVEAYDAALARGAGWRTLGNRGVSLEALGRLEAALESYDAALAREPAYFQAHHNRGSALFKLGRLAEAQAAFEAALAVRGEATTWNFHGVTLERQGRAEDALLSFERAIGADAALADAWSNRAAALRALGRHADARKSALEALRLRPGFPEALNGLGAALTGLRRFAEAEAAFREAIAARPEDPSFRLNLGMALELAGDLEGAAAELERAEALDPSAPEPTYARGLVDIRRGELAAGLRRFEVRWSQAGGPTLRYPRETLWLGEEPLEGRSLLVHAEQGFGDVLQFARFAPSLADRAARVVFEAQPALVELLASLSPRIEVRPFAEEPPAFDRHVPVMSLALALGAGLDTLPQPPYLAPPAARLERWRARLGPAERPRVGLAWSGNPAHSNDKERSLAFEALAPLLGGEVEFISLQTPVRPADAGPLQRSVVRSLAAEIEDFADTAALASLCDLVVSVDTSVAHLAGALGRPLLLLLPEPCDWRWMAVREDTPWYPRARLLRQARPLDWSVPLARARAAVNRLAAGDDPLT